MEGVGIEIMKTWLKLILHTFCQCWKNGKNSIGVFLTFWNFMLRHNNWFRKDFPREYLPMVFDSWGVGSSVIHSDQIFSSQSINQSDFKTFCSSFYSPEFCLNPPFSRLLSLEIQGLRLAVTSTVVIFWSNKNETGTWISFMDAIVMFWMN